MKGDRTASLLRLVGSSFIVTGSAFDGGSDPAVSVEFSKGNLTGTFFADGSGLRVSGSVVELERGRFERIAGTAVLAERGSTVSGTDVACTGTGTGLSAESGSTASVDLLSVHDAAVGVSAGQADAWFGPGRVVLTGAHFGNVTTPYVQEEGGTILVDGRRPELVTRTPDAEREWRYERKYPQEVYSAAEVNLMVRRHPALFIEAYPERWVNSLYYDTPSLGGLADSVNGLRDRVKVRVRWYGELTRRVETPVLEFKRKRGRLGSKDRYALSPLDFGTGVAPLPEELHGRPASPRRRPGGAAPADSGQPHAIPPALLSLRRPPLPPHDRHRPLLISCPARLAAALPTARHVPRDRDRGQIRFGRRRGRAARARGAAVPVVPVLEVLCRVRGGLTTDPQD